MSEFKTNRSFLVVGCGGLGCYLVEGLLRLNVKKIVVCDPDVFSDSNLNRQLYSAIENIGKYKTDVANLRAKQLNYQGDFVSYNTLFREEMLEGIDVVLDGLDNIKDRLELENLCHKHNIPLIHGAVEGNSYQVGISMPSDNLLHNIYKEAKEPNDKKTNVITVQMCAAKQLSLAVGDFKPYFEVCDI